MSWLEDLFMMEALESEWDIAKNAPLTFKEMTRGSGRKVWWRCKNGHEWLARFSNRVRGSECPFCRGKKPSPEWNLAVCFPAVAAEWHPTLNGDAAPEMMLPHSNKRVWWRCKEGHEWQAKINNRTTCETECPVCSGKQVRESGRDLCTLFPEIAMQWHPVLNGELQPQDVLPKSNRRVWWICKLGHEWESTVHHRVEGRGCPYCSGQKPISGQTDLETLEPELAAQWHPTRNGYLRPSDVTLKSHKRVWWICEEGHEWQTTVFQRAGGNGCPVCCNHRVLSGYNDLLTVAPELAAQWHPVKNGELKPDMVLPRHNGKVWWVCKKGHEWQASPNNRMAGCGGPFCNQHRVISGMNSLAMVKPEVAQQWESGMNGKLTPDDISPFSNKKVWWSCEHGHKWKATVASRSYGHGCPICWNHKQKSRRFGGLVNMDINGKQLWQVEVMDTAVQYVGTTNKRVIGISLKRKQA